jgi:hypothetical protein
MTGVGLIERARRVTSARRYGNSLPILLNQRYRSYVAACQKAYSGPYDAAAEQQAEVMRKNGFVVIEDAIDAGLACAMSERISGLIANEPSHGHKGRTAHLQYRVSDPLAVLGEEVLDLFRGKADGVLRSYFRSWYRLHSPACYRSVPSHDPDGAWLWHTDNYPSAVKKIMLYLTDCDPERGSTSFITPSDTAALRRVGYYGVYARERLEDVSVLAKAAGIKAGFQWPSIKAGSAIFFDNNSLHRANIPKSGYRDVITFTVLPSREPWDVALKRRGLAAFKAERSMFPNYPDR